MFRSQETLTCQELGSQAVMKTCSRSRYGKSGGGKLEKKWWGFFTWMVFNICLCFGDVLWKYLKCSEVRIGSKPERETALLTWPPLVWPSSTNPLPVTIQTFSTSWFWHTLGMKVTQSLFQRTWEPWQMNH